MEAQVLKERLEEMLEQANNPGTSLGTMAEDLREAFYNFAEDYAKRSVLQAMLVTLEVKSLEPALAGTLALGFWMGHDYALEYGQLRGD